MAVSTLSITPRVRQPGGCCSALVEPEVSQDLAASVAGVAKAVGDPTRLQLVDAVRRAAPEAVCACELKPLFGMSQPAISKHLKVLCDAGILAVERRGVFAYFYIPESSTLEVLRAWLTR